jgi:maltose-binding protein MalE
MRKKRGILLLGLVVILSGWWVTRSDTSSHPLFSGRRLSCQQCHRATPIQNGKTPDTGFYEGRVAMMIDGQWQVRWDALSQEHPEIDYGVAPVPSSSAHPELADTAVIQGPVVFIPADSIDKGASAQLLAWLTSPEVLAEAAYTHTMLPVGQTAAQDARFQNNPDLKLFMDLEARPDTRNINTNR